MQMGFNNDVPYRGLVLHIQTEDHGLPAARVTSHVFYSGAIIDSLTRSYADEIARIDEDSEKEEFIRRFMKGMHRHLFRRIQAGELDGSLPADRLQGEAPAPPPADVTSALAASASVTSPPGPKIEEAPPGLEIPVEMISTEGFDIAGELGELGDEYELKSRGAPMDTLQLRAAGDTAAFRGMSEDAWQKATQIGDRLLQAFESLN